MNDQTTSGSAATLTASQQFLQNLWEEHVRCEFATHDTNDTLATMVEDAYVNHIPVMTGGVGLKHTNKPVWGKHRVDRVIL